MAYFLGLASKVNLEGVHPKLVAVVKRAIQLTSQDFSVVEGVRTYEGLCQTWGQGRTAAECEAKGIPAKYAQPELDKVTWLADPFGSKHAKKPDGWGHAVDIVPYPISWALTEANISRFNAVAAAMKAAAAEQGTDINWGGDWKKNKDRPHFELA